MVAPHAKRWHCIDYTIVRRSDLACSDCHVIRGAECGTDHNLLCLTFHLLFPPSPIRRLTCSTWFDVRKLMITPNMSDEAANAVRTTRAQLLNPAVEQRLALGAWQWHWSQAVSIQECLGYRCRSACSSHLTFLDHKLSPGYTSICLR